MFDFHFFLYIEKWKKKNLSNFNFFRKMKKKSVVNFHFFLGSKRKWNETNPEIKKKSQSPYKRFARNCCHFLICFFKSASILFGYLLFVRVFCNGGQLYHFFLWGRRRKSGKKIEENAGDRGKVSLRSDDN